MGNLDPQLIIQTLGPTGAVLVLGFLAIRGVFKEVWPWLRDQYLARMVDALEKLAVSTERFDQRQAAVEQVLTELRGDVSEIKNDQAALFGQLQLPQPSRPRANALQRGAR